MNKRYACDIETDNLLYELIKIHCIAIHDIDSDYNELFVGDERIREFLDKAIKEQWELIFHNGFVFDLRAINKVYGIDLLKTNKIQDTIVLSQLLFGDLKAWDYKNYVDNKKLPTKYIGKHKLEAWGYRLGCLKDEYIGGFQEYTETMGNYCLQDALVTKQLYLYEESMFAERLNP